MGAGRVAEGAPFAAGGGGNCGIRVPDDAAARVDVVAGAHAGAFAGAAGVRVGSGGGAATVGLGTGALDGHEPRRTSLRSARIAGRAGRPADGSVVEDPESVRDEGCGHDVGFKDDIAEVDPEFAGGVAREVDVGSFCALSKCASSASGPGPA